jgi:mRNA interferase MazF
MRLGRLRKREALNMKRGEVWWASLPDPVGSGPGMRRPVLIVQSNPFNESRIATAIIAVITSNLTLADAPGNLRIGKSDSGLSKPSVVNVSQLLTVDRGLLTQRVKTLPAQVMARVSDGLRLVLSL